MIGLFDNTQYLAENSEVNVLTNRYISGMANYLVAEINKIVPQGTNIRLDFQCVIDNGFDVFTRCDYQGIDDMVPDWLDEYKQNNKQLANQLKYN